MKRWEVYTLIVLAALGAWAVVLYPPGTRVVRQERNPTPTADPTSEATVPVTLLFVGDIMLSRSVGDMMTVRSDWSWPFAAVASVTHAADLAFANLETTISMRGSVNGCGYCFRADPRVMEGLVFAGFDVLSVANNHMWDYGLPALEDTLSSLAANDIDAAGGGRVLNEARGPVIRTVRGTRIAYLAYTNILPASAQAAEARAGVNLYDPTRMTEDITRARSQADVVVVSFHTGTEYEPIHNADQERIYHGAIDAGADIIIGHHPHVVQDIEKYNGKWIAYSLGNFIFDQNWSDETRRGLMLTVTVIDGRITDVASRSVDISKRYQASLGR